MPWIYVRSFKPLEYCIIDSYKSSELTCDPAWDRVLLLIHGNGDDGSSTIIDSSPYARSLTAMGTTTISTLQSQFGGSSVKINGRASAISVPASANFNFYRGDFTIEMWRYLNVFGLPLDGGGTDYYTHHFCIGTQEIFTLKSWQTSTYFVGNNVTYAQTTGYPPKLNTWEHIALVRYGTTITIYIDGIARGTSTVGETIAFGNSTSPVYIGYGPGPVSSDEGMDGYFDDIRVTRGARYTGNFSIPTSEYPDCLDTSLNTNLSVNNAQGYLSLVGSSGSNVTINSTGDTVTWGVPASGNWFHVRTKSPIIVKSYCEFTCSVAPGVMSHGFGIQRIPGLVFYNENGAMVFSGITNCGLPAAGYQNETSRVANGKYAFITGDIIGIAFDPSTQKMWVSKNGIWLDGDPSTNGTPTLTVTSSREYYFTISAYSCNVAGGAYTYSIFPSSVNQHYPTPLGFYPYADVFSSRTILLAHADETVPVDTSIYQPKTIMLSGTAVVSDTKSKFGPSAFFTENTGTATANGVIVQSHQDFQFRAKSFTIEMWAYLIPSPYVSTLFSTGCPSIFQLTVKPTTGLIDIQYASTSTYTLVSDVATFSNSVWHHVAIQRRDDMMELFIDGVLVNTIGVPGGMGALINATLPLYIGKSTTNTSFGWTGYIDEINIMSGAEPRYPVTGFTPNPMPWCPAIQHSNPDNNTPDNNTPVVVDAPDLFSNPAYSGYLLDFTDRTTLRNAGGTQAGIGEYIRAVIPVQGTFGTFACTANGPMAQDGYVQFFGNTGASVLQRGGLLRESTNNGLSVVVCVTEPAAMGSNGVAQIVSTQYSAYGNQFRGPEFVATGQQFLLMVNGYSGGYTVINHPYTRVVGTRTVMATTSNMTTINMYKDGVLVATVPSGGHLVDNSPTHAIGADWLGTYALNYAGYAGKMYSILVIDKVLTPTELDAVTNWMQSKPL